MGAIQYSAVVGVVVVLSTVFAAFIPMQAARKKQYLVLSLGFLAFLTMFHSESVGSDTSMYLSRFNAVASTNDILGYIESSTMEPGYLLYSFLLSRITNNSQILFIVTGAITYLSIGRFLNRYCSAPGLFVCALVMMLYFDTYLSAIRQTLAMAITLFAYPYLRDGMLRKYVLVVLLAALFHYSALILLVAYPVCRLFADGQSTARPIRIILVIAVAVGASAFFDQIISLVLVFFPKYRYYDGSSVFSGEPQISIILKICVFGLMYAVPRLVSNLSEASDERADSIIRRASLLNIFLLFTSMNASVLTRLGGYCTCYALLGFSDSVASSKRTDSVSLTLFSLMLLYFYGLTIVLFRTPEWYTTYPFSFCFGM